MQRAWLTIFTRSLISTSRTTYLFNITKEFSLTDQEARGTRRLGVEGGKDQVPWPVDPVPGMSQKGTDVVSPGHHLLSCGARFEPNTF